MGLCETSNFSIFTFGSAGHLKVCTRYYSNCFCLTTRMETFGWKRLQNDDITLQYSIIFKIAVQDKLVNKVSSVCICMMR